MAMANLRDGGIIIIGASEANGAWNLAGMTDSDLVTYDPDKIIEFVNSYASPDIRADSVLHRTRNEDGAESIFLCISILEFDETPIVCKKNGNQKIQSGAVYVRSTNIPGTTRVQHASEMHDLLELAAEKRARKLLATMRRIGAEMIRTDADEFDRELEEL